MSNRLHHSSRSSSCRIAVLVTVLASGATSAAGDRDATPGLTSLAEYTLPALEVEVAGIHPHPTVDGRFLVVANAHPVYAAGQSPLLPVQYRGKLLDVDGRTGAVVRAVALADANYGGLAYAEGALFISRLEPPEILKVHPVSGEVLRRIPVSAPVGGLAYDARNARLLAQIYVGMPHLAVIDVASGRVIDTLPSDESAMDLAEVDGHLLCTWLSSFDAQAFGELRRIDSASGKVTGRVRLDVVHTSMAPLDRNVAGVDGFISLVRLDDRTGRVGVRKYAYDKAAARW